MKEKNNNKGSFMSFNSNSFSSFWDTSTDTDVDDFLGLDVDTPKGKDIVALAGYKRAIGNFVNIVTGKNIPVTFNNNDESFTDGKKVVIGSNLNEKNFDVAVGLALHEGSHIALSDFNLLKQLEMEIPEEVYVIGENKNVSRPNVINLVKSVLNYVEDRRIDTDTFKSSPGYKGYYHSMYNKYFYSKNVDKGLLSSELRMENIDSYMFRIINLHNKNRQLGSLKGLKEIYSLVELWNMARLEDTKAALNVALDVARVIFNSIDKIKVEEQSDTDSNSNTDGGTGGEGDEGDSQSGSGSSENGDSEEGNGSDGSKTISDEELQDAIDNGLETPEENLDNDENSGPNSKKAHENYKAGINENHARELMELHSISPNAGYTQEDVIQAAYIMSGWRHKWTEGRKKFNAGKFEGYSHQPGKKTVMGKTYEGGKKELRAFTNDLSNHTACKKFIATKLCRHFVTENPTDEFVGLKNTVIGSLKKTEVN